MKKSLSTVKPSNYIPTLDGFRAVAIVIVIFSHEVNPDRHPYIRTFGREGVFIFFALSGYLITSRLIEEYDSNGRISLRDFYLRRVFRILPPAIFYLSVVSLCNLVGWVTCSWAAIRSALFFYANYVDYGLEWGPVPHFWSLSVEEHFYLIWPSLLIGFGVRKGWRTAAILAVIVNVWRVVDDHYRLISHLFHNPVLIGPYHRTDMIADTLFWGCCLAFYLRPSRQVYLSSIRSTILAVACAATLLLLNRIGINHSEFLLDLIPTILLGAVVAAPRAPIGRLLELSLCRFVGRISYSLYIWQQLFLFIGGPVLLSLPLKTLAILACALFSYWVIEQPAIQLGRRIIRKTHSPAEPVMSRV